MGPRVGFLAARVSSGGTCRPVHAIAPSTARPTGSQFKLLVLGALAERVEDGRLSWNTTLTVDDDVKSLGNGPQTGSLQFAPSGSSVTVREAATKMISISDNTAADMLVKLLGKQALQAQFRLWTAHAAMNEPFLTTREVLLLHYVPGLADSYLATPRAQRAAFLASSVDPLPAGAVAAGYSDQPRYIEQIEWFASPADICRAFGGLETLSAKRALRPALSDVLSLETGTIGLDRAEWPTVWFKGGSESGVLTLGWLAKRRDGKTFVVEAMVSNPDQPLSASSITDLVVLARDAFALLAPR
jgi:hypothetical protein